MTHTLPRTPMNWFRRQQRRFWMWMGDKPVRVQGCSVRRIPGTRFYSLHYTIAVRPWATEEDKNAMHARVWYVVNRRMRAKGKKFKILSRRQEDIE